MGEYNFREIEKKWIRRWQEQSIFQVGEDPAKEKYYVLDMFPYPSGAGLHVGHPLGYIASDIYARYKKLRGYNVLHPMGFDAFGLPAEQYAIQTGQHPAVTTEQNIARYREQLLKLGFSYDWSREIKTSDPSYYKWTQWIFIQFFNSWYNRKTDKAEPIETLIQELEQRGNIYLEAACDEGVRTISADEWKQMSAKEKSDFLMHYRLAYHSEAYVNWCPALGTVLANDEVKDGLSERGGFPVERKLMPQWSLRITAYAERLLKDLDDLDWSESIKEAQRNWIGRSEGAEIDFPLIHSSRTLSIRVFTTRPDTVMGVTYLVLAPEHPLVKEITTSDFRSQVERYIKCALSKSERDRQAEVENVSGQFTGAYARHPFTGDPLPIWVADYVLAHYGTGAVMAVPAHDARDHRFASAFNLPVKPVIETPEGWDIMQKAYEEKRGKCIHSGFLNGYEVSEAIQRCIQEVEKRKIGRRKIQYRMRDAIFGRQRYWGEPIPIYYDEQGVPHPLPENELPLLLPEVDKYLPTDTGEPPLARAVEWKYKGKYSYETTTMPGWAGSSWYFLRYMDPHNQKQFASKEKLNYWKEVDLYIGGAEHATGHLLYFRFWTKFLKDRGYIAIHEPARKLINQGMILGKSAFAFKVNHVVELTQQEVELKKRYFSLVVYVSADVVQKIKEGNKETEERFIAYYAHLLYQHVGKDLVWKLHDNHDEWFSLSSHIDVKYVDENDVLDVESYKRHLRDHYLVEKGTLIYFYSESESFVCYREIEKMSKSKWNVINPDDIIEQYGADTLRCYEMFLGPVTDHKPWDTKGIEGVHRFLKKCWKLFYREGYWNVSEEDPSPDELRILHRTIKRVTEDIERGSLNTVVSHLMVAVNLLTEMKCNKRAILSPLVVLLSPYAPFIAEELWQKLGHTSSVTNASFPAWKEEYIRDENIIYPVSFNGKMRFRMELPVGMSEREITEAVLQYEMTQKWLGGKVPKKVIVVPNRIINVVT